nr:hypothetical protein [Vineibacter terrae]
MNRLELSRPVATKYHKISHDPAAIDGLFVDLFLAAHGSAPSQIVLDLDATDVPLHCTRRSTAPAATWRTASRKSQGDLFADRTSSTTMRANQLCLWFAAMAHVLICALRRIGLKRTQRPPSCGWLRNPGLTSPGDKNRASRDPSAGQTVDRMRSS